MNDAHEEKYSETQSASARDKAISLLRAEAAQHPTDSILDGLDVLRDGRIRADAVLVHQRDQVGLLSTEDSNAER
jgi:hypothetical protein